MSLSPHISLEQWRALIAVVDSGGYAQAAQTLHKSQSAVTYAVQKLEDVLGVKAFEIQGRKAVLTATGQLLYRRALALLEEASGLESAARKLSAGWEAEIGLAVETVFPTRLLFKSLAQFGAESPHTRIEIIESVLSGTTDALREGKVELAITAALPAGFLGDVLLPVRFIAVASPDHPLHRLKRMLTNRDLRMHRHLVVRDSGLSRRSNALALEAKQRWTVSNLSTSIEAVRSGYGFAWFPEEKIREELEGGALLPLKLREGSVRQSEMYLVFADRGAAGPGTLRLAELIRETVANECRGVIAAAASVSDGLRSQSVERVELS